MNKIKLIVGGTVLCLGVLGVVLGIKMYDKKESTNNQAESTIISNAEVQKEEHILYKDMTADLSVDYSDINNLINESDLVAVVTIESADGENYNPEKDKYVPVYTTGVLKVEEVISDYNSTGIEAGDEIEYVRLGGDIEFSEYVKGITEAEKTKLEACVAESAELCDVATDEIVVKSKFLDDVEIESETKYVVFLKYSNDYQKYNIFGFEYGLREYDSTTDQVKNNETEQFEALDSFEQEVEQAETL